MSQQSLAALHGVRPLGDPAAAEPDRTLAPSNQLVYWFVVTTGTQIGIFEAKTHLSELVQRAAAGEVFILTRRGKPMAVLQPLPAERAPLTRGCAASAGYWMADDFDAPLADLADLM